MVWVILGLFVGGRKALLGKRILPYQLVAPREVEDPREWMPDVPPTERGVYVVGEAGEALDPRDPRKLGLRYYVWRVKDGEWVGPEAEKAVAAIGVW